MNIIVNDKNVNIKSLEFADAFEWDAPNFCNAYVEYAEFDDGTVLSEDEIEIMQEEFHSDISTLIFNHLMNV